MMKKDELINTIKLAFSDVKLDGGISINQTKIMSEFGKGCNEEKFQQLPYFENTGDWVNLNKEDLSNLKTSFLDPKGFRYYIPALMNLYINNYDPNKLITTFTIFMLDPNSNDKDSFDHKIKQYELLNVHQRQAIANFLYWVPKIVTLENFDKKAIQEALIFWKKYLSIKNVR